MRSDWAVKVCPDCGRILVLTPRSPSHTHYEWRCTDSSCPVIAVRYAWMSIRDRVMGQPCGMRVLYDSGMKR